MERTIEMELSKVMQRLRRYQLREKSFLKSMVDVGVSL
jgi:hypothetical protein